MDNNMLIIKPIFEFLRSFWLRLRSQGPLTTLRWLRTVGLAWLTGRISLSFSKVTPNIYIGPQYGRYGKRSLMKAGVTASMSLRAEFDDAAKGLAMENYNYIPIIDNTAPTIEQLQQGVSFINEAIRNEGVIYVHCGSGVGRAPTMVAAYLIAQGKSVDDAITQIQAARPFIRILPNQRESLRQFAATMTISSH
jgi:protein-tyrosine phosphatase